jgi:hypothetical protein
MYALNFKKIWWYYFFLFPCSGVLKVLFKWKTRFETKENINLWRSFWVFTSDWKYSLKSRFEVCLPALRFPLNIKLFGFVAWRTDFKIRFWCFLDKQAIRFQIQTCPTRILSVIASIRSGIHIFGRLCTHFARLFQNWLFDLYSYSSTYSNSYQDFKQPSETNIDVSPWVFWF